MGSNERQSPSPWPDEVISSKRRRGGCQLGRRPDDGPAVRIMFQQLYASVPTPSCPSALPPTTPRNAGGGPTTPSFSPTAHAGSHIVLRSCVHSNPLLDSYCICTYPSIYRVRDGGGPRAGATMTNTRTSTTRYTTNSLTPSSTRTSSTTADSCLSTGMRSGTGARMEMGRGAGRAVTRSCSSSPHFARYVLSPSITCFRAMEFLMYSTHRIHSFSPRCPFQTSSTWVYEFHTWAKARSRTR